MPNQFWSVYKADALWSLTILAAIVLGKIGVNYFRRWKEKRRIERELQYVAPELREERRAELEGRVAVGLPADPPTPLQFYKCPHCTHRIEVLVLPGLELQKDGGDPPERT